MSYRTVSQQFPSSTARDNIWIMISHDTYGIVYNTQNNIQYVYKHIGMHSRYTTKSQVCTCHSLSRPKISAFVTSELLTNPSRDHVNQWSIALKFTNWWRLFSSTGSYIVAKNPKHSCMVQVLFCWVNSLCDTPGISNLAVTKLTWLVENGNHSNPGLWWRKWP